MNKNNLGSVYLISGAPREITPLFESLRNWGGIDTTVELLDYGNPETFVYFLITENKFLTARSHCWVCQISNNSHKGKLRGNWAEAQKIAQKEWDSFEIGESNLYKSNFRSNYCCNSFHLNDYSIPNRDIAYCFAGLKI